MYTVLTRACRQTALGVPERPRIETNDEGRDHRLPAPVHRARTGRPSGHIRCPALPGRAREPPVEDRKALDIAVIRTHQPPLRRGLSTCPGRDVLLLGKTRATAPGRDEIRRVKAATATGLDPSRGAQAYRSCGTASTGEVTLERDAATGLTAAQADATEIAHRVRRHRGHREPAPPRTRHRLDRGCLPRPNPYRPQGHGRPAQPRHRSPPPWRTHQHRRRPPPPASDATRPPDTLGSRDPTGQKQ
jgi:hypothetical protein